MAAVFSGMPNMTSTRAPSDSTMLTGPKGELNVQIVFNFLASFSLAPTIREEGKKIHVKKQKT
jgi:hypothetical protein